MSSNLFLVAFLSVIKATKHSGEFQMLAHTIYRKYYPYLQKIHFVGTLDVMISHHSVGRYKHDVAS